MKSEELSAIGVVIVAYNSSDVIVECLDSLLASDHPDLKIMICDNASPDDTVDIIRAWADKQSCDFDELFHNSGEQQMPEKLAKVSLLRLKLNGGFAAGVNAGLTALMTQEDIDFFWILNPDCIVTPKTASAYALAGRESGQFGLMGGRLAFPEAPHVIQSDGGRINKWTGICGNVNQGMLPANAKAPDPETLDYVAGANFLASRRFLETVGLMREDYFLYFEEIDWAFRRGDLPLKFCQDALVLHHNGTAIGSGSLNQRASGFSNYFNYRNRIRFVRRYFPASYLTAYLYSFAKIIKLLLVGAWSEANGAFCGLNQLQPPKEIRSRLSPEAGAIAFGESQNADE